MKKLAVLLAMIMIFVGALAKAQEGPLVPGSTVEAVQPGATAQPAPAQPAKEKPKKTKPEKTKPAKAKPEKPEGAPAANDRITIKINYWPANYVGKFEFSDIDILGGTGTLKGQKVDLVDGLGLENPQNIPEVEIDFKLGNKNRILLAYYASNYGGEKNLHSNLDFGGYTFQVGTKFKTTFEIDRYKFAYEFMPLSNERGSLGVIWGVEYFIWRVGFEGRVSGTSQKIDKDLVQPLPIPIFGIAGNFNIGYGFGVYASFSGIGASYQDISASYTDLDAGLYWKYKLLYIGGGYRSLRSAIDAKLEHDKKIKFDLRQEGWLVSLGINF